MKRISSILFTLILLLFLIVSCAPKAPAKTIEKPGGNETSIEETPNYSPLADAGEDIKSNTGNEITLDGSNSSDPDGDKLSFLWDIDGEKYSGETFTFIINEPGTYYISLTVSDGKASDSDMVQIIVEAITLTGSEPEIEYFFEIAFGTEYGASQSLLHKWTNNIRIKVNGTPTSADLDTLNQVVTELNSLVDSISLQIVGQDPNIDIHFTTMDQFASIIPSYVDGNMGYFSVWWNEAGAIYYANILIASEGLSQQERSHLIREELTQSLGIMKDSNRYEDSIFFQGWTNTINYTPGDRAIISLLYDSRLKPNMTQDQVKIVLGIL
ncbi:MAG: DUF2927 domain-containing protein [Actinobacteria bacterium]|nr:DUF2927 domain-containing protein [Actinomycetota bacterium]